MAEGRIFPTRALAFRWRIWRWGFSIKKLKPDHLGPGYWGCTCMRCRALKHGDG